MGKRKGKRREKRGGKKQEYSEHSPVKAKKYLGQHFLADDSIAQQIAQTLSLEETKNVVEIGPGTGVLTKFLLKRDLQLIAMEIDKESVAYLLHEFPLVNADIRADLQKFKVIEGDFLQYNLEELFNGEAFAITGNFPYNISTQIVFKLLENRHRIPEFSGMFQKEVAKRICEKQGSKTYGILSVLVQAFYDAKYLFTVHPQVFDPPPKVQSGVIHLRRKEEFLLDCNEALFFRVVKTSFNQRRKTLRNSLKTFNLSDNLKEDTIFDRRPEQLAVSEFIALTKKIADDTL